MTNELKHVKSFTTEEKIAFRDKYDVFFFDMDGTLDYLNTMPIPGVAETVEKIASLGKTIHVFTDTCLYNKESIVKKVHKSFPFIKQENILTAPMLIVNYLKSIGFNKKIYGIGEEDGILKDLRDAGFNVISDTDIKEYKLGDISRVTFEEGVGAVILGVDMNFSYVKMLKAVNYLKEPNTMFLVSHFPIIAQQSPIIPAAGSLALPISTITKKEAQAFSKGTPASVEYIHSLGYSMDRCIFVGDGPVNDICCGNKCGMDTLLVLCGAVKLETIGKTLEDSDLHRPTYIADSVADLYEMYASSNT